MDEQKTICEDDPVRKAFIKMIGRVDPEDFFCPDMKGLNAMVSLDDCELKARGGGCSDMLTCKAYQRAKKKISGGLL